MTVNDDGNHFLINCKLQWYRYRHTVIYLNNNGNVNDNDAVDSDSDGYGDVGWICISSFAVLYYVVSCHVLYSYN